MLKRIFSKLIRLADAERCYKTLDAGQWFDVLLDGCGIVEFCERVRNREPSVWAQAVIEECREAEEVMEIGSGTAEISLRMALAGKRIVCMDFSERALDFTRKTAEMLDISDRVETLAGDVLEGFSREDKSVDCVWSSGLLEHFPFDRQVHILRESARLARKLVVTLVPNASSLAYVIGKDIQERRGTWAYGREIPIASLGEHYRAAGIELVKEYTVGAYHAMNFLPAGHELKKPLGRWIYSKTEEVLNGCRQGYLLVSVGRVLP